MTTLEAPSETINATTHHSTRPPLRESVKAAVENYFTHLDGQPTSDLYNMVITEVEEPLLIAVMSFTQGNQSQAAQLLGLSRGTLRKKLDLYGLL